MSNVGDFLIAFGAFMWWAFIATCIAFAGGVLYRRLLDRCFPLERRPGYVPPEALRSVREPSVTDDEIHAFMQRRDL